MAEADRRLLSEKLSKYGVLGAGIMSMDSSLTLRHAQNLESQEHAAAGSGDSGVAPGGYSGAAAGALSLTSPQQPPKSLVPAGPSKELSEAIAAMAKDLQNPGSGQKLKREHILEMLTETTRVQGIVQQEISVLARELAEAKNGKKKRKPLTFLEGHKKIQEMKLPREPLEEHGISESVFQNLLMEYQDDDEVMQRASMLLHPVGRGDPDRAKGMNIERIVEIHQFMVKEMDKVLQEFRQLPQDSRQTFTGKACETTAELLVSVAVEQQLSVRCEDVEQAVIMYDEALQEHPEFARCTERLAYMMQLLIGATQDRFSKDDFMSVMRHMADSSKQAKAFAKKLFEDYRAKSCSIVQAYERFEDFTEQQTAAMPSNLSDLSQVELQLCYEEYRDDTAVKQLWDQSGAEVSVALQSMMANQGVSAQAGGARSSSAPEDRKGKKTKPSDIVEMQELMVDEMKRISEAAAKELEKGNSSGRAWKPEILAQVVQSLASAAVEKRYGVTAEEMTMMGFQHAATLQRNERFVRATEKQQEILMAQLPQLCQAATAS